VAANTSFRCPAPRKNTGYAEERSLTQKMNVNTLERTNLQSLHVRVTTIIAFTKDAIPVQ